MYCLNEIKTFKEIKIAKTPGSIHFCIDENHAILIPNLTDALK